MKKRISPIVLIVGLLMINMFVWNQPADNGIVVAADVDDDYSYDDEYDDDVDDDDYEEDEEDAYDDDDGYDEDDYDEDESEFYQKVVKKYANVKLSQNKPLTGKYNGLDRGNIIQYSFTVSKKTSVILRINDSTYGNVAYRIINSNGKVVFDTSYNFSFETKRHAVSLNAGTYQLQFSGCSELTDVSFTLCLANASYTKTLRGMQQYTANPELGSGSWTSSNKKVVKVSNASGCSTTFIPVKPGKATITFKSGSFTATYRVTVKKVTKTIKKKVTSCDILTLNPKQGSGTWKTGNKQIASFMSKKSTEAKIKVKKKGKTTITFQSPLATYYYKITVTSKNSYPIDRGYITLNSADGVEPSILISNNSNKTIKYVTFRAYFYNQVGDPVYYFDRNYADMNAIGPLKPWEFNWYEWEPIFYNNVTYKMKIKTATVTYMDGSKKTVKVNRTFMVK